MKKYHLQYLAALILLSCLSACQTTNPAKVTNKQETGMQPASRPMMVYVADFDLDAQDIQKEEGILSSTGPGRRASQILEGSEDSDTRARHLVDFLTSSLIDSLNKAGVPTQKLPSITALPPEGWLIEGQFTEVQEGNRLQRAVIGFGKGAAEMQIHVKVSDLMINPNAPFLVFGTAADSGKAPGGAVTLNPFVAAGKFALSKNASDNDVKRTAAKIASEITDYMKKNVR